MRQRSYGRDTGLTLRMFFTMFMLAGVWVAFMGLLFWGRPLADPDTRIRPGRRTHPVFHVRQAGSHIHGREGSVRAGRAPAALHY